MKGRMKPILFNTEMVQAILTGHKTVTRRVVNPQPQNTHISLGYSAEDENKFEFMCGSKCGKACTDWTEAVKMPYAPGDILYVRETWAQIGTDVDSINFESPEKLHNGMYIYKADKIDLTDIGRWRPSIHMPKDAARIFLLVTDVRVKRLQDMPLCDVWDEGTPQMPGNVDRDGAVGHKDFAYLWDSTIKPADRDKYGWDANPWVWVIEFEKISKGETIQNA